MRTLILSVVAALAAACPAVPVDPDPAEPPPDACAIVVDCTTPDQLGAHILVDGACFLCVQTSVPEVPQAWTRVASFNCPPPADVDDGAGQ